MSARRPPLLENSPAMRRILAALKRTDMTQAEISERAFVSVTTLQKGGYMKALLASSACHVCGWNPPPVSGHWAPIYRHGAGKNVPCPPAAGNTEYTRRYRQKLGLTGRKMAKLDPFRFSLAGLLGV